MITSPPTSKVLTLVTAPRKTMLWRDEICAAMPVTLLVTVALPRSMSAKSRLFALEQAGAQDCPAVSRFGGCECEQVPR